MSGPGEGFSEELNPPFALRGGAPVPQFFISRTSTLQPSTATKFGVVMYHQHQVKNHLHPAVWKSSTIFVRLIDSNQASSPLELLGCWLFCRKSMSKPRRHHQHSSEWGRRHSADSGGNISADDCRDILPDELCDGRVEAHNENAWDWDRSRIRRNCCCMIMCIIGLHFTSVLTLWLKWQFSDQTLLVR